MRILLVAALAACIPQRGTSHASAEASAGFDPDACGNISTSDLGRKLYAFLVASAELDRATSAMDMQIHTACAQMAGELGLAADGDTRTVCQAVANELHGSLSLVASFTPPSCTTDMGLVAQAAAECEGRAPGDMAVTCEGEHTSECHGYASVDASAECKSSAEVRASVQARCTEPQLVLSTDDAKARAIRAGMPVLLTLAAKGEIIGKAAQAWGETAQNLANSTGDLVGALGTKSVCVAGQLSAIQSTITNIQARFSVAIDVQASFTATAQ